MEFDPFVLPFCTGIVFVIIFITFKSIKWIKNLSKSEKRKLSKLFFSLKILSALKEIFLESLLHRKIFKENKVLGYMHMSLAFGWFLLIATGNLESRLHSGSQLNMPYYPIFFKYFQHANISVPFHYIFSTLMDFFLFVVLTGLGLAFYKRFNSRLLGMKKTTKLNFGNRVALIALWAIFPLRLLAESFTAGIYHNGGFLTGTIGDFFAPLLPLQEFSYIAWWAYSCALGLFFLTMPFSRYMHIFAEVILILFRQSGIKATITYNSYSEVEVFSCSRCGICIDKCQLESSLVHNDIQPAYFIKLIRNRNVKKDIVNNCLLCYRCKEYCPVGIENTLLRVSRKKDFVKNMKSDFNYIKPKDVSESEIAYFAGCMTHLTPAIKKSTELIFKKANVNYTFIDSDGSICCGRPLILSGMEKEADELMEINKKIILKSNAKLLVTSCPICLKTFTDKYNLDIPVLHHSQYFKQLIDSGKIKLNFSNLTAVYHDPCELGRGSEIYNEPRSILKSSLNLISTKYDSNNSLCCGGSLGNTELTQYQQDIVTKKMVAELEISNPDIIATSCPLCKKTIAKHSNSDVKDISEIILESLQN